jgi:hypothetical protein
LTEKLCKIKIKKNTRRRKLKIGTVLCGIMQKTGGEFGYETD